ncbi:MAG: hypothetical protein ABUL58_03780, partial [Steroidobacter sp.]
EAIIAAGGDFDPRQHAYPPGSRVFSTSANRLICDDKEFEEASPESVVGILRIKLNAAGFVKADFPVLKDVFQYFASNIGKSEEWGKVPLSIATDHHPFLIPLRVTYETRATVDKCLAPLGDDRVQRLRAVTLTLVRVLRETENVLSHRIATTLALETVNGMAKTAPMTDAAMAKINEELSNKAGN